MKCLICGKNVGLLAGTRVDGGRLCKECAGRLPALLLKRGRDLQECTLRNAMQKTAENVARFSATASYGELHIDEIHGLFCVAKSLNSEGKPVRGNNVFSSFDLMEVGLSCSSPRELKEGVYVNVEFTCSLADPYLKFTKIIKGHCRCKSKRTMTSGLTWEEPSDMLMFQAMFQQMLTGTWEKVNLLLCGKTVHEFELEKARALFMLPEGFSRDDLEVAYVRMKQVYENLPDSDGREVEIINKAFWLLQAGLEHNNTAESQLHANGDETQRLI